MLFGKKPPQTANRRESYRKRQSQAYALEVHVITPAGAFPGVFRDLSIHGAAASFPLEGDPALAEGDVVELSLRSRANGEVVTPGRAVYGEHDGDGLVRYGFRFVNVGNLYSQLDSFYARLFNRRESMRVRPEFDEPVSMSLGWRSNELEVHVSEISATGTGLVLPLTDAYQLQGIDEVRVGFVLPGVKRPLAGRARILNRRQLGERAYLGLAFDLDDAKGLGARRADLERFVDSREADMHAWEEAWS